MDAIKPAFKRLFDAKEHWHNAEKMYFDPEGFRRVVNSCIQDLRSVTFLLQSNKRSIESFDSWYEPWQTKMRANKNLRWLVDSRNYIVKKGDLELLSVLRIEVIGSYLAGEIVIFEQQLNPNLTNHDIYRATLGAGMPKIVFENSYVKLRRKWIDKNYPEHELLELMSSCWSSIAELLYDAPGGDSKLKPRPGEYLPSCMHIGSEDYSIWMKVANDTLIPSELVVKTVEHGLETVEKVKERYGDSALKNIGQVKNNYLDVCKAFFEQAKIILKKDGYHSHLAFLFREDDAFMPVQLENEDQADKYRTIRFLASEVEKHHATNVIIVSEMWTAVYDPKNPYRHASQAPDRSEALALVGLSKSGENHLIVASFARDGEEIRINESSISDAKEMNYVQPILDVWKNHGS